MKGAIIAVLVVVALVQLMAMPGEAVGCGQVNSALAPCIPCLTGAGTAPSAACCGGAKNVKALAPTTADRRAAGDCVKAAASHYPNINEDSASSLPKKCGVEVTIPISKNTNCHK
ncbi:hypothetical protein JCGZ_10952 [Jatropha curcas]|uniref:Non-specific lipid-transfer protein n=1 Tax=Jatropha curcas TaxID=180498 RepID=A0A067KS51_JATCU|nr:hypothetical protein JCGZ_10952 [Jatropha curcas]